MDIPAEILFSNILPRLPAKSKSRFKCVSKEWNSFLSAFHHKFLFFSSSKKPTAFHTLDCESPYHGLTPTRSLPFEVESGRMSFITSSNGLVCVGVGIHEWATYADMILWNPYTGDYKRLSRPEPNVSHKSECCQINGRASGLYYCHSDDDYRLLRVTNGLNVYIYSLKSDSWRKLDYSISSIGTTTTTTTYSETWGPSINLHNQNLYFLKKRETVGKQFLFTIIKFDTKTEYFNELPTPSSGDDNYNTTCLNSILLRKDSKIYLCQIYSKVDSRELCAKLWKMDGDGDGAWTKVATYPIPRKFYGYEPLHLTHDGKWATLCRSRCHVYILDPAGDFKWMSHRIDNAPQGKYSETLVSPNRYK